MLTSWSIALTVENRGLISEFICICQASVSQHFVWQTLLLFHKDNTCIVYNKQGRQKNASSFQQL